ncbi:MAG TPA: BamA/TamA family outer membrane protein [Ferruginibacter sp.]|jgi:outer membrane protein insertion porin family|nr:BamA/TamA family outer membrane protein [Ferruginibacter sp.]
MTQKYIAYCLIVLLFASGCGVKTYLPAGQYIYRKAIIKVTKESGVTTSANSLRKELKAATRPVPNKFLFGKPYKVWWWYKIGDSKNPKGVKAWLRGQLGEPPVYSSRVNAKENAEDLQAYLENIGYFHSVVHGDTTNKKYFTTAVYKADVFPQYKIKSVTWIDDSESVLKTLTDKEKDGILKPGRPYKLADIETEREKIDIHLKAKGYYFFNPDYVLAYADSTVGNHQVDLFLNIINTMPEKAKHSYTIRRITVFPNYTLIYPPPDTSKVGTFIVDGINIRDTVHNFKPALFTQTITYRPGMLYSSVDQNTTLNRFINLGAFKFVKNRYDIINDTLHQYNLNAYYYLTQAKKKVIQTELDGFSTDNSYLGTQVSVNWKNRNVFKGAEQLNVKIYGGIQLSINDSLKKNNNYQIGTEVSLTFPRYVIPFFHIYESNLYPPQTQLLAGYEYFIEQSLYTKNVFRFQYQFDWKRASNKRYMFAPISISYINASNITDSFYTAAQLDPSILYNVYSEVILGSVYTYNFTTLNPLNKNQWYFAGGIDVSGNIAGLITGAKDMRTKNVLNTPFDQYAKFDLDLRYKRIFRSKTEFANRLVIGIGAPYNNSAFLPFSKEYVIGGANSMRGFPVRTLGPGSYLPTINDIKYFQVIGGDYEFLFNSELRFAVLGKLKGALFADVGNVWTKDTLVFGPAGQLKSDWYKELAVSSGFGLRYDATVILIRLDLGMPLRKPYLPDGQRWVFDQIALGDNEWRRDNLILNLAIGYPF